ncbi:MFS transporter [Halorhabdus rudnickae]|uniref:MFS transporter n=1 Tax=Halorhabdus rudnickae TaxID=1775544 RepID=UPI0010846AE3|nr:MFS transporter [Halorhabdus rudnickae]
MHSNARDIVVFTGVSHAIIHTYELSIPILVVIWLLEFPVTTATLGIVVTVGYGLFGIGALPGGVLADRFSARTLIIAGLGGMGLSFLALSFAESVLTIAIALGGWGIAASVYHPAALSLISTGVRDRGTGFAYHGMAGNAGIALGPLLTASLLILFDWQTVTRLLVIPTIGVIGYALTTDFDEMAAVNTDDERATDRSISLSGFVADSRALFTVGFLLALGIVMMNGLFYRGTLTFLPEVLGEFLPPMGDLIQPSGEGSPVAEAFDTSSYLYAVLLTVGIGGQYVGGKLSDRLAPTRGLTVVFGSLVVIAIGFVPAARAGLPSLLLVSGLLGFFLFALQPLYQATIAEYTPPDGRGVSYGYTYLVSFGVGAAGAAIAGVLLSTFDVLGTLLTLSAFPAVGVVFSVLLSRWDD